MSLVLPPPPIKEPISTDKNGNPLPLYVRWLPWVAKLYEVVTSFVPGLTSAGMIDASVTGSINAAVASGAGKTIVVSTAMPLIETLTVPVATTLKIVNGGSIVKASTYTLAINGKFEGCDGCFVGFSAGDVAFGAESVKEVHPGWWGAIAGTTTTTAIQSAINSLSQGRVVIGDGTFYAVGLTGKSNVDIIGRSKASVIKTVAGTPVGNTLLILSGVSNVTVSNLTLDGNAANVPGDSLNGTVLVAIINSSNIRIAENTLTDNDYLGVEISVGCSNINIEKNTITNTDVGIITLDPGGNPSHDLNIYGNVISGGTSEGISLFSVSTVTNVIISNNNIQNKLGSGILTKNSSNVVINQNIIKQNASGISLQSVSGVVVNSNVLDTNTYDAVFSAGAVANSNISNNIVKGLHRSGINLFNAAGSTNVTIENNLVSNLSGGTNYPAIGINNGVNCQIIGNRVFDDQGSPTTVTGIYLLGSSSTGNIVANNKVTEVTGNQIWIGPNVANTKIVNNDSKIQDQGTGSIGINIHDDVLADAGDADYTFTGNGGARTVVYHTAITAARAVNLDTFFMVNGWKLRIVRDANCTGAFNVNVGTGPLKALTAAGQWCEVEWNGTAWVLTAYGSL